METYKVPRALCLFRFILFYLFVLLQHLSSYQGYISNSIRLYAVVFRIRFTSDSVNSGIMFFHICVKLLIFGTRIIPGTGMAYILLEKSQS